MAQIILSDVIEKETLRDENRALLRVTRHIPHFDGDAALCEKLNGFYGGAAEEFLHFCEKKYAPALRRGTAQKKERENREKEKENENEKAPYGASMNWTRTFQCEDLLSLVTDISIFDGKTRHLRRFCHTWLLSSCTPLSSSRLFDTSGAGRKKILSAVCDKVRREEGGFRYYPDAERRARRYFDIERSYLTPRGVAFYYPDGLLFPSEGRFPAYVVPYELLTVYPLQKELR